MYFTENSSPEETEMRLEVSGFSQTFPFSSRMFPVCSFRHSCHFTVVGIYSQTLISLVLFTHLAVLEQTEDAVDCKVDSVCKKPAEVRSHQTSNIKTQQPLTPASKDRTETH